MSRSRILSSIAAASLGIALFGACSTESLTERAVGFGLEQAIEGDQDINLDFSDDGTGGFSISTDEGDFALNFDEDSGGIVFNTDEGDGVISFDQDNGTVNFNTDEGDAVLNFDEDNGTVTFATEDGEVAIVGGNELPASWPASIGVPATLVPGSQAFSSFDMGDGLMTTGSFEHADNDPYAANAIAALEAAGWDSTVVADENGSVFATMTKDGGVAQVVGDPGFTSVTLMSS